MENIVEFLDWMVALNVKSYPTVERRGYIPTEKSHFYLEGSQERFSSEEIVLIWSGKHDSDLNKRWMSALCENSRFTTKLINH